VLFGNKVLELKLKFVVGFDPLFSGAPAWFVLKSMSTFIWVYTHGTVVVDSTDPDNIEHTRVEVFVLVRGLQRVEERLTELHNLLASWVDPARCCWDLGTNIDVCDLNPPNTLRSG
jgi:hypothetical protein